MSENDNFANFDVSASIKQGLTEMLEHAQGKRKLNSRIVKCADTYPYSAREVREIRNNLNMTKPVFANILGVSLRTVDAWEKGTNMPCGSSSRLLTILQKEPDVFQRNNIAKW